MTRSAKKQASARVADKSARAIMVGCPDCGRVHLVRVAAGGGRSVKINNSICCDCGIEFRIILRVGKSVNGKISNGATS